VTTADVAQLRPRGQRARSVVERTANPNAERAVLCAALLKPDTLDWLDANREDFQLPAHRALWEAMRAVHLSPAELDTLTLEAELRRRDLLDVVGGLEYLERVALAAPTADNVEHYAQICREGRIARQAVQAASAAVSKLEGGELAGAEVLDWLVGTLGQISRGDYMADTSLGALVPEFVHRVIAQAEQVAQGVEVVNGVATGVASLDRELGGLPRGKPSVIAGRPGKGKSTLIRGIAKHVARSGGGAVIFSNEDPTDSWLERAFAEETGIDLERINRRELDGESIRRLVDAANELRRETRLHLVMAHGWSAKEICRAATVLERRMGRLDFVGVDFVQLIPSPERGMKKHESIAASAEEFAAWVGRTNAALAIGSQIDKSVEKDNRRPRLGDLRYGEGLAIVAKLVLLLYDPQLPAFPDDIEVIVPKRNQGEASQKISVRFDRKHNVIR